MTTVLLSDTYPREIKTHVHIKNVYTSVDSNIIHDSQKAETTHTSKNCVWVNCVFVQATTQS